MDTDFKFTCDGLKVSRIFKRSGIFFLCVNDESFATDLKLTVIKGMETTCHLARTIPKIEIFKHGGCLFGSC